MRCLHCGKKLSLLRKLSGGEFCSDAHRAAFHRQQEEIALNRLIEAGARLSASTPLPTKPKGKGRKAAGAADAPAEAGPLAEALRIAKRRKRLFPLLDPLASPASASVPLSPLTLPPNRFRRIELAFQQSAASQLVPRPILPATLAADLGEDAGAQMEGGFLLALRPGTPPLRFGAAAPAETGLLPVVVLAPMPGPVAMPRTTAVPVASGAGAVCPALTAGPAVLEPVPATELEVAAPPPEAPPLFERLARLKLGPPVAPPALAFAGPASEPEWLGGAVLPSLSGTPAPVGLPSPAAIPALGLPRVQSWMPAVALSAASWDMSPLFPLGLEPSAEQAWLGAPRPGPAVYSAGLPAAGPLMRMIAPESRLLFSFAPLPPAIGTVAAELAIRAADAVALGVAPALAPLAHHALAVEPCYAAAGLISACPADGFAVEQVLFDTVTGGEPEVQPVEAAAEEPGVPALYHRMFPVQTSRPLPGRPVWTPDADRRRLPLWDGPAAAEPELCSSQLKLDQADGSGPTKLAPPKPSRFRLPSFTLPRLPRWGGAWLHAPADLKWVSLAIPAVLLLVIYSLMPSPPMKTAGVTVAETAGQPTDPAPSALAERFSVMQKVIMERAAIRLIDDFRSGLGAWNGAEGWAKTWQYNAANFVTPGRLAIYTPTVDMQDYEFSFLAQIDRRSLNWVVRAADEKNYHAIRIVITQPGPLPKAVIARYTVINGRQGPVKTLPLPLTVRTDTLYKVRMEVKGDRFITYVQDQVVDSFTDDRLPTGGVGFFSPQGDRALLRWVSVMHQYDYLGRLCAVLAPYTAQAEGRRME